jgi:phage baseplate assembly protein gpV
MNGRAGVVTGVVEEVNAAQGRVRVEYRGIEQSLLSPWAYIAAPMSGGGRGALFMPEPGDEVLVCFGDGDFAHPYVVGFLWNGEQTSPETEAHNRVIVTPGNNQLRFEDRENATRVVLRSRGERELLLDDAPGAGKDTTGATEIEIKAGSGIGVTIRMTAEPTPSLEIIVGATHRIQVSDSGISLNTPGSVNVTCTAFNVTATTASFTGTVQCSALIAGAVSSGAYNPAPGNTYGM